MTLRLAIRLAYRRFKLVASGVVGSSLLEKGEFFITHRRWPRISPATTFNEKLLVRKLAPVDPRYPIVADKVAVRDWVSQRVGSRHLIPVIAIHDYDDLDRLKPAPGQVIKCANRSRGVYFTRNDGIVDRARLIQKLKRDLDFDFQTWCGEPWYGEIPKRVIVEKSLCDENGRTPSDYKFFVFHGVVKAIQVHLDRFTAHRVVVMDRDWQRMPVSWNFDLPQQLPPVPVSLPRMLEVAETLGGEFDFVRVDLYEVNGNVYFGELTLAPGSAMLRFVPASYDKIFGDFWRQAESISASMDLARAKSR